MATNKVIVEGSSVTASQMKDFWRQASEGVIDFGYMQAVLSASRERREMFAEGRDFKELPIIQIDRSKPFDPTFLGEAWTVEGEDERSLTLTEIALEKVRLFNPKSQGDKRGANNRIWRAKLAEGHITLDAKVFQTLWENQHLIPSTWKRRTGDRATVILFDGTLLRKGSTEYTVGLQWTGSEWFCSKDYSGGDLFPECFSAVLPVD